ncbi:MAG: two-component sensor histidine kinase [Comamonadaceae bacterium]|nr:MAG: two-component sensor histidine kinase [Comamonadaceae bacterium]
MAGLPRSLQGRLIVLVLGTVVAVWLATAAATWIDARHELDELLDGHLAQAAALLVVQQAREIEDDDAGIDAPVLHRYAPKVAFQVFHKDRLALRSANAPAAPMVAPREQFRSGFRTVTIDGTAWRMFATHGAERDVQVYMGEQLASRDAILWALLRSLLWPMALALPLLAAALAWAVYRGVSPVRMLGRALAARNALDLHPVAVTGAPAEMAPMVDALNGLFERITSLLESERRFTADAAHELRTPIAAIRAQAQVALGEADEGRRRQALQRTLEGCDRAARLVGQLLTLARLEATELPAAGPVDMSALTRRVVAELAPQAIGKQQVLELDAQRPCLLKGDETLLAVLVRNLVDNAVRYSPASARVKVRVHAHGGHCVWSVEDSGPGMAAGDHQRLGERFFRVTGHAESGSGLGWSIARRIAAVHGLTLHSGPSPELGGLAVRIEWAAPA